MSKQLKPMQELILWNLLISGEEPMQSVFDPTHRNPLIEKGYIRLEKRGRAKHVILEDKTWDWITERLQSEDFSVEFSKRATTAIPVFETLLVRLGEYLRKEDIPLSEFLQGSKPDASRPEMSEPNISRPDLEQEIRIAYASIQENSSDFRVRISQLKSHLKNVLPSTIDETLLAMQQSKKVSLRPMEDPQEITETDKAAAIDLGGGDKRYFILLKD